MAGDLTAFLSQNAIKVENVFYAPSKRFIDPKTKEPIKWEIRALTSDEDMTIRKSCTKLVPVPMKKNQYQNQVDTEKYIAMMAVACTVYPNLNDVTLQNSYGVMSADALLGKMLIAGEYTDYLAKIQEVNGYTPSMEEAIEQAKN